MNFLGLVFLPLGLSLKMEFGKILEQIYIYNGVYNNVMVRSCLFTHSKGELF